MPGPSAEPGGAHKGNGATLICTKDPQGYTISLDVHRWQDHIIKRHPEMRERLERVKLTIEDPQVIAVSATSATAYYYRLAGRATRSVDDLYLLVVVERNEQFKTGAVKPAHLLKNLKTNQSRIVWLKKI